jgi:hypothetical protein
MKTWKVFSALLACVILVLGAGPLYAEPVESADIIPVVLSDSDQAALTKEKAKLDKLRKGLLDDIGQQNTECGQVAESNTFQVDLCQNRKEFLLSQMQNYRSRLTDYRAKIQKALFMAPQGKSSVQSGLIFKDIPAPPPPKKPVADLEIEKDAPNEPKLAEPQVVVSSSPVSLSRSVIDYVSDPENNPRVKRAKEEADRFHDLHVKVSKAMLNEVDRAMGKVRAETVSENPRLGREEIDRIVSQNPEVRRISATWYLIHNYTDRQAKDYEEDYVSISKEVTKELNRKMEIK